MAVMVTASAAQKPPLGQKMPSAGLRLKNRPLSQRMHREKCRPLVRLASGAPVFANGAVTAAMGYAFNQLQEGRQHEEGGPLTEDQHAQLRQVNRIFSRLDPSAVNELSMGELDMIMRYDLGRMERFAQANGGFSEMSASELRHMLIDHGDGQFYSVASYQFRILNAPAGMDGVYRGGHINYYYQGFIRSAAGHSMQSLHDSVINWNVAQGVTGQGLHNFTDIPPSIRWATYGYDYQRGQ